MGRSMGKDRVGKGDRQGENLIQLVVGWRGEITGQGPLQSSGPFSCQPGLQACKPGACGWGC